MSDFSKEDVGFFPEELQLVRSGKNDVGSQIAN